MHLGAGVPLSVRGRNQPFSAKRFCYDGPALKTESVLSGAAAESSGPFLGFVDEHGCLMGKSIFISQKVICTSRPWETFCHVFAVSGLSWSCTNEAELWAEGAKCVWFGCWGSRSAAFCARRLFLNRGLSPLALPAELWCTWALNCGTRRPSRDQDLHLPSPRPGPGLFPCWELDTERVSPGRPVVLTGSVPSWALLPLRFEAEVGVDTRGEWI